ncbi:PREDICTED: protein N-terminal asparagine amidohydrolase isoform X1 [Populus euphratica]|uniref:Protein N-terminal asparagine amidohydrolase isoform X1 n=1 Tax=Populus euphratica TaxID=75702 RepID=A0AAJ6V6X1_POPEU|nr:PREDICTED: protein N-terminal asparagine amidohydrolase isoform X1 [Populus euphratica]
MIFVDGLPFPTDSSQERGALVTLLEHPKLVSASNSFEAMQEVKLSASKENALQGRWVYVFQREFATVDPAIIDMFLFPSLHVKFIGTDEATTCVGLVIRNQRNGMTSVAHMDSTIVVDNGLTQMLSLVVDKNFDDDLDVHLIGGFEDVLPKQANGSTSSRTQAKGDGYSFPLCTKIIETLREREEKFHIQTLFVLGHNTKRDSQGNAYPVFNGFLVKTSTGSVIPASFDRTTRRPDEIVRRIRISASHEDPTWNGKLLETYDTQNDRFVIAPCSWTFWQVRVALTLQDLSDEEILLQCSTSPSAEGPEFVDNLRRQWDYLIKQPHWNLTFPTRLPRVFEWTADGSWKRCLFSPQDSWDEDGAQTSFQMT